MDELRGKFCCLSLFPQYFTKAILGAVRKVTDLSKDIVFLNKQSNSIENHPQHKGNIRLRTSYHEDGHLSLR